MMTKYGRVEKEITDSKAKEIQEGECFPQDESYLVFNRQRNDGKEHFVTRLFVDNKQTRVTFDFDVYTREISNIEGYIFEDTGLR